MAGVRVFIFVLVILSIAGGAVHLLNRPRLLAVQAATERQVASIEPSSNEEPCVSMESADMEPKDFWTWDSQNAPLSSWKQVKSTPVVGDLDRDGISEIVFNSTNSGDQSVLRVLDGKSGAHKFSVVQASLLALSTASPVLIDLDGDGRSEIIYLHEGHQKIIALNGDGSLRWQFALPEPIVSCQGGLAAADLDSDGRADMIVDNFVVSEASDKRPLLKSVLGRSSRSSLCTSFAMSLDSSRPKSMQIVSGEGVFSADGREIWKFTEDVGFPRLLAAADVQTSVTGLEVVVVAKGKVHLFDGITGQRLWTYSLGETAGPPSIADLNGDGNPEILVTGSNQVVALSSSGEKIWSQEIKLAPNTLASVSSYDLNSDSLPDVILGDSSRFLVLGPKTGKVFRSFSRNTSPLFEYPVPVDVDGDGHVELVLPNPDLKVVKAKSRWAPGRSVWNQFSYFVSNVTDDLRPTTASPFTGVTSRTFRSNRIDSYNSKCADLHHEATPAPANRPRQKATPPP